MSTLSIFGRSSSHYTRCARIFAHEFGLAYHFEPITNLLSTNSADYAGNPALRLPIVVSEAGAWYGALNGCRELARRARREREIVWPEDLSDRIAANAQELVSQGMASEVTWVMASLSEPTSTSVYAAKNKLSIQNSLAWLEQHLSLALGQLFADRALSFLEVSLFCFITHLRFRDLLDVTGYPQLQTFVSAFAERASVHATEYRFDPV
jgi:glutathione S-transferase